MACVSGTNIVNDGLVFHFDLENGVKSWKGKPTSNLATDTPTMAGWAGQYTLVDSNTKTFLIQTTQNNSATTSAWRTWYWDVSSYIGQTMTISGDVTFVSETNATFSSITIGQGNTGSFPVHITGSSASDRVTITQKPVETIRMTWTGVINSAGLVGFTQWITNVAANGANGVLRISNVQIEVGDIATKFVNGARLDTASIVDVSPTQSTITAANLTYRQDDTPTFDGTDDYFKTGRIPGTGSSTSSVTWCVWTKPAGSNGNIMSMSSTDPQGSWNMPPIAADNGKFRGKIWSNNYLYSSSYTLNEWYYVCLVFNYSSGYQRLYVNGELVDEQTSITYSSSGSNNYLFFGQANPGADNKGYYSGEIGISQVYNKALTSNEIKNNFEATRSRYGI